jgi:predicted DNA-binding transcriptional regulator AlpA
MRKPIITNTSAHSRCLQAKDLQEILGLSKSKVYDLLHRPDFPTVRIDKRMVVPRDSFFDWLERQETSNKIIRRAIISV